MPVSGKTTEKELATAALRILSAKASGEASYREIIAEAPKHVSLTPTDHIPSKTRPLEKMWEQRTRNITCHHLSPGNFINKGLLASVPDGLRITQLGRDYIKAKAN